MVEDYSKILMDRFLNPRHAGEMKSPSGVGKVGNVVCGDIIQVFIKVEKGKITKASFLTYGCAAAIAVADALCEIVKGKTLNQAKKIKMEDIIKELSGIPYLKRHCSELAIGALKKAIDNYENKSSKN